MTLAEQVGDLRLRRVSGVLRDRRDERDLNAVSSEDLLLYRRVRRKRNVVLVAALRVLSLAVHHADDPKRQVRNAKVLSDRIRAWKKIVGKCLADHDHTRGSAHV